MARMSVMLYKVKQAAEITNLSQSLIYRLCSEGHIAHVRIAKSIRIPKEALDEFLRRSSVPVSQPQSRKHFR